MASREPAGLRMRRGAVIQKARAAEGPDQVKTLAATASRHSDDVDDDSDFSESGLPAAGICAALTQTTLVDEPVKIIHKNSRFTGQVTVHNEQELDQLLKTHPTIAALPADSEVRKELNQLAPKSRKHVFIMMDSGASVNAAYAKKHFPGWIVRTSAGQLKGEFANTANGDRL